MNLILRDDAISIEEFVTKISGELGAMRRTIGLFGITSCLKKLDSYILYSFATNNACFIGILGMGGIGKLVLLLELIASKCLINLIVVALFQMLEKFVK